ncbi:hypothetical protein [Pseudomonas sp. NFIX28]|uniref:hypothetical protein n=1 Tax=Pseudomonas sp. NFIX28 TaxID=1566235 RepID=UPI001587544C|nr:hypothetical protein [Pseudomonas sp. NFIX28]
MSFISLMGFNENNSYSMNSKCLLAVSAVFCVEIVVRQKGWPFDIWQEGLGVEGE